MHSLVPWVQMAATADPASESLLTAAAQVIAIPAAIITLLISFLAVRKTRLESRKLELEISEKEAALRKIEGEAGPKEVAQLIADPLFEGRRVQEIILRFIMLFVVLQAWNIVEKLFPIIINGVGVAFGPTDFDTPTWVLSIFGLLISSLRAVPTIGYYLVLLGLGGPIVIQTMKHLRVKPPRILKWLEAPKPWTFIVVGVLILFLQLAA